MLNMLETLHLSFVTPFDSSTVTSWAGGVSYFMSKAFSEHSTFVNHISVEERRNKLISLKWRFYTQLLKQTYHTNRELSVAKNLARQIEKKLMCVKSDAILSLFTPQVAYLQSAVPLVIWADATFENLIDFYPEFTNLCQESIEQGHLLDQNAMNSASLVIFTSDWAAKTAVDFYRIAPAKVKVVPYGANLTEDRNITDVDKILNSRPSDECRLLFLGTDWIRKGGDVAVAVARSLNQQGIPTKLVVVGCQPPVSASTDFVECVGFIDKSDDRSMARLNQLFCESHFLILPTRTDCTPNVFYEANSFAVPSISTNVGGISTIIKDNLNGKTFALDAETSEYSDYIFHLFKDHQKYRELAASSFDEYTKRLNWKVNTGIVRDLICKIL
ncbi:MAG: group 1 glycosyl transferase [Leptolyngbya sp. ERB_1_1]